MSSDNAAGLHRFAEDKLPWLLAWGACVFLLVFVIFDLPELLMPRSLAVVETIDLNAGDIYEDEETDNVVTREDVAEEIYVRYVAMGEERSSFLEHAPRGLHAGDTLTVVYSEKDPYDVYALSVWRYILDAFIFAACAAGFAYLWIRSAKRRKTGSRSGRAHFTLS